MDAIVQQVEQAFLQAYPILSKAFPELSLPTPSRPLNKYEKGHVSKKILFSLDSARSGMPVFDPPKTIKTYETPSPKGYYKPEKVHFKNCGTVRAYYDPPVKADMGDPVGFNPFKKYTGVVVELFWIGNGEGIVLSAKSFWVEQTPRRKDWTVFDYSQDAMDQYGLLASQMSCERVLHVEARKVTRPAQWARQEGTT